MAITRFNAKNGLSVGTGSIGVVDSEGNVEAKNVGVTGSITPDASGLYDLGSPTKVWRNLYVSNISGSLTGSNVTAGQVVLAGTGGVLSGSNNFWWDNSKQSVGIGTSTLLASLHVSGSSDSTLRTALFRGGVASPSTPLLEVQDNSGVSLLVVSGSGNVGVGTSGNPGSGRVISSLTLTTGGTLYTNGTYAQVALTGGTGTGATADIVISGNAITSCVLRAPGQGYVVGDVLSVAAASVGGTGSGFQATVATTASIIRSDGTVVAPRVGAGNTAPRAALDVVNGAIFDGSQTVLIPLGSAAPSARLEQVSIFGTIAPTATTPQSISSFSSTPYYDLTNYTGTVVFNLRSNPEFIATPAASNPFARAVSASFTRRNSGDLSTTGTYAVGSFGFFTASGVGSTTTGNVYLVEAPFANNVSGHTVSVVQNFRSTNIVANGATVTTLTQFYGAAIGSTGGTITTLYGLRLEASTTPTITNRWGISQEDTLAKNYLAGNTGIGGTNPTARLTVTGSTADNTADALHVLNASNASMLYVRNDGLVGVGTSSSTARFQVQGSTTATTPTMIVREGVASPTGGAGTFDVQNSAGTSILFVSGSGNVGVGTANPSVRLHVMASEQVHTIFASSNANRGYTDYRYNTNTVLGYFGTASGITTGGASADFAWRVETGALVFATSVNERARIDSSGNVGIGTTTYTARLFVSGSSTASTPTMVVREGVVSPTGGAGTFDVQNSSGTSILFVTGSGLVGIGTTIPVQNGTGLTIYQSTNSQLWLQNSSGYSRLVANSTDLYIDNNVAGSAGNIIFRRGSGTTESARIDSSGNVGIGTTTYTARLFVSGSSTASTPTMIVREGVASPTGGVGMFDVQSSGGVSHLFVSASGNVGVGTNVPLGKLQVSGSSTGSTTSLLVRHGVLNGSNLPVLDAQNSAGTSLFFISGSGNVGIGTTTFLTNNRVAVFSATPTSTFDGQLLLSSDTASSAAESGAQINFQMYDGTSYRGAVYIKGAKENSTSGNYGTILTFGTRTNGSTSITERMRIDSNGNTSIGYNWGTGGGTTRLFVSGSSNPLHPTAMFMAGTPNFSAGNRIIQVLNSAGSELFYVTGSGDVGINNGNLVIGTSGKGIDFGATTNSSGSLSSEVLDDYERGTWTPGITTGGGSITLNATVSRGAYVKIGRMVWIGGTVRSSAVSSPTGICVITGLPFTSDTWNSGQTVYLSFVGEFFSSTGLTAWAHTGGTVFQSSNEIDMFRYSTSAVYSDQVAANWDASCEFAFTFCYNANV